jgi:hypothetical protein
MEDQMGSFKSRDAKDISKVKQPVKKEASSISVFKLSEMQNDLFNFIQLMTHGTSDFHKCPPGSFYPLKIPISSLILSF